MDFFHILTVRFASKSESFYSHISYLSQVQVQDPQIICNCICTYLRNSQLCISVFVPTGAWKYNPENVLWNQKVLCRILSALSEIGLFCAFVTNVIPEFILHSQSSMLYYISLEKVLFKKQTLK